MILDSTAITRLQALLDESVGEQGRLAEAALLIAQMLNAELDVIAYLRQLDDWAAYLKSRIADMGDDATDRIECLNQFLFDELGFAGDGDNYYDEKNSFLNTVIDRRLGLPITLSVIYIELGRRIGLPLQGVSFPGHFLVILPLSRGVVVLDPYSEGASLEMADLEKLLFHAQPDRAWDPRQIEYLLEPATTRDILVRMLRNLKGIYWDAKDIINAIWVQDLILIIDQELAEERRDRGILREQAGHYKSAVQDFTDYLEQRPNAVDAELIRARMVDLSNHKRQLH